MDFVPFRDAVAQQFARLFDNGPVFVLDVYVDELWNHYLSSFPEGTNPVFRVRTQHDCSCCRSFIKNIGALAAFDSSGHMHTVWDIQPDGIDEGYRVVAAAMRNFLLDKPIGHRFLTSFRHFGNLRNVDEGGLFHNHFFVKTPNSAVVRGDSIGTQLAADRSAFDVFKRGLKTLKADAIATVLELIASNSLYRGNEFKHNVSEFQKLLREYNDTVSRVGEAVADRWIWQQVCNAKHQAVIRIRNTSIGQLLIDLSEDDADIDTAVRVFELMVAPTSYQRPTAVVTKTMVEQAQKKIEELGLARALNRRFAVPSDVSVNDVVYVDRAVKAAMKDVDKTVFDQMIDDVSRKAKPKSSKLVEMTIDDFLDQVVPDASRIELLVENRLAPNLVSLTTAVDRSAPHLFKWGNPFAWSYNGGVADSIKQRVKAAGGKVDGELRISLSWFNRDDLDIWLKRVEKAETYNSKLYYGNRSLWGGHLDVDMNAYGPSSDTPVENIIFNKINQLPDGRYELIVNQFNKRVTTNVGFEVEVEFRGVTHQYSYDQDVHGNILVFVMDKDRSGIKFTASRHVAGRAVSKDVWGLATEQFHPVEMITLSPNHWDGAGNIGNRHVFFFIDGCQNTDGARGFYNEFLSNDLAPHRKVMEIVGSKTTVSGGGPQLSGLGFSDTIRNHVTVRVHGQYTRDIKISF